MPGYLATTRHAVTNKKERKQKVHIQPSLHFVKVTQVPMGAAAQTLCP